MTNDKCWVVIKLYSQKITIIFIRYALVIRHQSFVIISVPRTRFELARLPATPSKWCVYQFRHPGNYFNKDFKNSFPIPLFKYFSLFLASLLSSICSENIRIKGLYALLTYSVLYYVVPTFFSYY